MAKITFVTFYNDFSVGANVLADILIEARHDVSVIFFKLPTKLQIEWFRENPDCLEYITPYGDIMGTNSEINKPTDREIELLIDLVTGLNTEILCISSRSTDRELALQVLPLIRSKYKGMILAGGYGPTFDPETYARHVDYVFRGEAENTISELVALIEGGYSIKKFKNICYEENGKLVMNNLEVPEDVQFKKQTIPESTFYIEDDQIINFEDRKKVINIHAYSTFFGRGCIMSCSYCTAGNWRDIYKKEGHSLKRRRNRPIDDIIDELMGIKDSGITFIHFRDEFLTARVPNLKRFFSLYERKIQIPFWAYLVPKQVIDNPELLEMAVDAGFVDTVVGFQSGSDYINRTYFTRLLPNKHHLEYAELLAKYHINCKYDFIIFNPAERKEHKLETFKLIQALPKERTSLNLTRLFYLPGTPASKLFTEKLIKPSEFERQYCDALLYLICFVVSKDDFDKILREQKMVSSWQRLLLFYKDYLDKHGIEFPVGTHDVPSSITTHRYQRIIKKRQYTDVIVWGNCDYYKEMAVIFRETNIRYHIDDEKRSADPKDNVVSPEILSNLERPHPLFICSPQKQKIKMKVIHDFPKYQGRIYV